MGCGLWVLGLAACCWSGADGDGCTPIRCEYASLLPLTGGVAFCLSTLLRPGAHHRNGFRGDEEDDGEVVVGAEGLGVGWGWDGGEMVMMMGKG